MRLEKGRRKTGDKVIWVWTDKFNADVLGFINHKKVKITTVVMNTPFELIMAALHVALHIIKNVEEGRIIMVAPSTLWDSSVKRKIAAKYLKFKIIEEDELCCLAYYTNSNKVKRTPDSIYWIEYQQVDEKQKYARYVCRMK